MRWLSMGWDGMEKAECVWDGMERASFIWWDGVYGEG